VAARASLGWSSYWSSHKGDDPIWKHFGVSKAKLEKEAAAANGKARGRKQDSEEDDDDGG